MTKLKRKINYFCKKNINSEIIQLFIICILVLILCWKHFFTEKALFGDIIDVTIIVSFLFVSFSKAVANLIIYLVGKSTEDDTKLRTDYKELIKKYNLDIPSMIKSNDIFFPEIELCSRSLDEPEFKFDIEISDNKRYKLPKQIADNSSELFDAHKYSIVYNNTNIRLDDLIYSQSKGLITLKYSFTTILIL